MAKVRSPSYPAIGLKEAIEKVEAVYRNDYQNQVPREVAARHMGYASLNGKSLGVLAALLKYGLLEGRGDSTRVSDLAVTIIAHPPGAPDRAAAIAAAALRPDLFSELDKRYPEGKGSDVAIRAYLLTQKFIPQAADNALRSYRETKSLVEAEPGNHDTGDRLSEHSSTETPSPSDLSAVDWSTATFVDVDPPADQRRAVFDLTEGEVVITYPDGLSAESVADLQDYIAVFLKKARREAGIQ